ncbi:MAG: DUF4838 domain-containing protein [Lentisphaerae bacterium]|nr:DUF4838 domain-containing protein [Lentisphaerota bacterium]MBT4815066.1 DUF4838 domain-containing protein [Lentisphaerota bacterium]MBT5610116.1 DUF4838 domain-containing protein [Lentisphaerota bacterium]MBT7053592.1 DUF4838 domain-containing protein [Lentisphaerota bacterium]MBT7848501.1 DUF4838 domain-containing protein [Lentisphaerota bacterium]
MKLAPHRIAMLTSFLLSSAWVAAETPLVRGSTPVATVVTAAKPTAVAAYAAKELVDHVERATGVRLPICPETSPQAVTGTRVYIGPSDAATAAGVVAGRDPVEGCVLRTVEDALFVIGDDDDTDPLKMSTRAGTLWGVYELLETELGVRWIWPGEAGIVVPNVKSVAISPQNREFSPWLIRRNLRPGLGLRGNTSNGFTPEGLKAYAKSQSAFLRRHRMGSPLPLRYGHAFNHYWERYGEEHADWFQLLDSGKRGPTSTHARFSMCVSNPGLHEEIVRLWRKRKEADPDTFVNINCCENDIRGLCSCEGCLAWDGPQPETIYPRFGPRVVSDRYATFYRTVQEMAAQTDPAAKVIAYAYVNYAPPPSPDLKLNEHIFIGTVPDLFFPRHPEEQKWVLEQWDGWARTGARVFLRPNYFLGGYCMPQIFAHQFADEFRHEAANGMVFTDFDSLTGQWSTQAPNLYLLARLHTRPEKTADELLDELYSAFGPAKAAVKAYFDFWENYTTQNIDLMRGVNWSRFAGKTHVLFPDSVLEQAKILLTKAEEASRGERRSYERVRFLSTGFKHARLAANTARIIAEGSPPAAHKAIGRLVAFRNKHEGIGFSNLRFCSFLESRSWAVPEGYSGEPIEAVSAEVAPLDGPPTIPTRGRHTFVALTTLGNPIRARIACGKIGRSEAPVEWAVFNPSDELVARGQVPVGEAHTVGVPAVANGPHTVTLSTGRSVGHVTMLSPHAALVGRRMRLIHAGAPLFFWVPKGTKTFIVTLEVPGPGETAKMTVFDPVGTPAGNVIGVDKTPKPLKLNVPVGQDGKAWSVHITEGGPGVFEDYTIGLDPALPPYWAHTADRLLIPAR